MKSNEIIIAQRQRPLWQIILAAALYTLCIYAIYQCLSYWSIRWIAYGNAYLELAVVSLGGALGFSVLTTLCFDLEKKKLKTILSVGFISTAYFSDIELEYVSIFKKNANSPFMVNLWYKKNQHFQMSTFDNFEDAFDFAILLSKRLNIDLLDATERWNSKWIEK